MLAVLSEREAAIITLFYGLKGQAPMDLNEIGIQFSITRERVRQIKEKVLIKLRQKMNGHPVKSFLK